MARVKLHTDVEPYDLVLEAPAGSGGLDDQGVKYWERIRILKRRVRWYFPEDLANTRMSELQDISDKALQKNSFDHTDIANVDSFEERLLKDAGSIRNASLLKALKWDIAIAAIGVAIFVVYFALSLLQIWNFPIFEAFDVNVAKGVDVLGAIGVGLLGVAFGAIVAAFLSSRVTNFEALERLSRYDLPSQLYVALLMVVFLLALTGVWAGFFDVELAGESASEMFIYPLHAFPLGLVCGFAEPAISTRLGGALSRSAAG